MVIAEEQRLRRVESEVGLILASAPSTATVVYVISLGMYNVCRQLYSMYVSTTSL